MTTVLASLAVGIAVGYLAQRSRLCFMGGLRDWLLFRETSLLAAVGAFFLTAWVAWPLTALAGGADRTLPSGSTPLAYALWAAGAGLVLGFASVLANGCPLRQHVLAAQGEADAWGYLAGFAAGAWVYQMVLLPLLLR
ncbi:MAG TPA: YeeE/YedE thiosulfate transporter family protein [Symbiobacteriaceae bacterium]|jgi:hypothetical protein